MVKAKMKLGTKLISSFIAVAVIVSISGVLGLYFVKSIEGTLNNITDKAAPIVETSDDLIINLWEANKVQEEILISEIPSEIKEFEIELAAMDKAFTETYKELQALVDDKNLLDDLDVAKKEHEHFVKHAKQATEQQLLMLQKEEDSRTLMEKFDATGAKLRTMLDEFAIENEAEMQRAEDKGDALVASGDSTAEEINDILGELFEKDYPVVEASLKLQALIFSLQNISEEYLGEEDINKLAPIREEFETNFAKADGFIKILSDLAETDEDKQDAKDLQDLLSHWDDTVLIEDGIFDSHYEMLEAEINVDKLAVLFEGDVDEAAEALNIVAEAADAISDSADEKAAAKVATAMFAIISCVVAGLGMAVLLGFLITRGITKPVNAIIAGMSEGANQVASASGQVSSSSQTMADGASTQAASIEETSSSMEEMASMTKKNAENAGQADNLMRDANQVVETANSSMTQLTQSMEEISKASEETSKIIKTIDEIAFQTNLLALNAAVEAARAGEAGAGFAVVADEVRNLAMRAADAAKDTADLIEGTVKKVNDGSELVGSTNEAFDKVADSTAKVGDIVAEISEASKEQSSGIEQVNNAISEMDKVVQQNAANAEESASAAEEMSAQAEQLKDFVGDLVMLVTGNSQHNSGSGAINNLKTAPSGETPRSSGNSKMLSYKNNEVKANQVIPFDDDDDFKNF